MHRTCLSLLTPVLFALLLAACSSGSPDSKPAASAKKTADSDSASSESLPPALFSSQPFPEAVPLLQAKQSAKPGDSILFTAAIAGRLEPFTKGRAVMLVADHGLPFCEASHNCPTPWDACCETSDNVLKHAATVQITDPEGRPLKTDLNGQGNLKPGARLQIQGIVAQAGEGYFLVNATQIHVETQ